MLGFFTNVKTWQESICSHFFTGFSFFLLLLIYALVEHLVWLTWLQLEWELHHMWSSCFVFQVDPGPYYDSCVRDSCACDTGGDCECFCTAVAAYAKACNTAEACISWRTPKLCRKFDHNNCCGDVVPVKVDILSWKIWF